MDDASAELRALRERAYGPDADIRDDPRALRRLEELEAAAAGRPRAPARPAARRLGRWIPALWIASVLVTAGAAAIWTAMWAFVVLWPVSQGPQGSHRVTVLTSQPNPSTTGLLAGDAGARTFGDFSGLTLISTMVLQSDPKGGPCLIVMLTTNYTPESESIQGPAYGGCPAGAFPATVQLAVTADMPRELRDRFPDSTGLRFVLDGARVGVYADR